MWLLWYKYFHWTWKSGWAVLYQRWWAWVTCLEMMEWARYQVWDLISSYLCHPVLLYPTDLEYMISNATNICLCELFKVIWYCFTLVWNMFRNMFQGQLCVAIYSFFFFYLFLISLSIYTLCSNILDINSVNILGAHLSSYSCNSQCRIHEFIFWELFLKF